MDRLGSNVRRFMEDLVGKERVDGGEGVLREMSKENKEANLRIGNSGTLAGRRMLVKKEKEEIKGMTYSEEVDYWGMKYFSDGSGEEGNPDKVSFSKFKEAT